MKWGNVYAFFRARRIALIGLAFLDCFTSACSEGRGAPPIRAIVQTVVPVPDVGDEFELDERVPGIHVDQPGSLAAAPNDAGVSLVVWVNANGTYGIRVDAAGTILDSRPIAISTASGDPSIASDGSDWLVVWSDGAIKGTMVTAAGIVEVPNGLALAPGAKTLDQLTPAVAHNESGFFVAWVDGRSNETFDVYGARVTPDGSSLDPIGIPISTAAKAQMEVTVSANASTWLVVWHDSRNQDHDVYGARVASDGTVLDPSGIAISTESGEQRFPSVGYDGSNWFALWTDQRPQPSGQGYTIYGARIAADGSVIDASGLPVLDSGCSTPASLAHDGANWLLTWRCDYPDYRIEAIRVDSTGRAIDAEPLVLAPTVEPSMSRPFVLHDGSNWLTVWADGGIVAQRISPNASRVGSVIPIFGPNSELEPASAFNGTNWLVVWRDTRNLRGSELYGARVSASGTVIDTPALPIMTGTTWGFDMTASGQDWLAIKNGGYTDWRVYSASVSASGNALLPHLVPVEGLAPAVSCGEELCLAVGDTRATRMTLDGQVLDPGGLALADMVFAYPSVAWGHNGWLVVDENRAVRVTTGGQVSHVPLTGAEGVHHTRASYDGTNWLVVWEVWRTGDADVRGMRIDASGTPIDPNGFDICSGPLSQAWSPEIAYTASSWLVAWIDGRRPGGAVYATRVNASGTVLDPGGFLIADEPLSLDVGAGPPGRLLVTYGARDGVYYRAKARVVSMPCFYDGTCNDNDGGEGGEGGARAGSGSGGNAGSDGRAGDGGIGGTRGSAGGGAGEAGAERGGSGADPGTGGTRAPRGGQRGDGEGGGETAGEAGTTEPSGPSDRVAAGDRGCSCRLGAREQPRGWLPLSLLLAGLAVRYRGRSRFRTTARASGERCASSSRALLAKKGRGSQRAAFRWVRVRRSAG